MQTTNSPTDSAIRNNLLQQEQSLRRLEALFNRNTLPGSIKRLLSVLLEIAFFIGSILLLISAFIIPTDPIQYTQQISEDTSINTSLHNDDISTIIVLFKILLFVSAFIALGIALLLGRNRRKSKTIDNALDIVQNMQKQLQHP